MGANVSYDFSEYRAFFEKMAAAKNDFKDELNKWLEAAGIAFLEEVREQIISRRVIRTSYLLHTFERGGSDNVWEADFGALKLEVGSNLEYALWTNNGHRTFDPSKTKHFTLPNGEAARFVPGYWSGDEFIYDPNAKGGMVLKFHWVEGKHYFDAALKVFAPQFEKSFENKLQEWLTQYFDL
jgi:hypothetical protein